MTRAVLASIRAVRSTLDLEHSYSFPEPRQDNVTFAKGRRTRGQGAPQQEYILLQ